LPVTFVIVWIHSYLPCCSCRVGRRTTMVFLAISTLSTPVHCRLSRIFFLLLTHRIWHSWRRISPPLHDTLSLFPKPIQFPENHPACNSWPSALPRKAFYWYSNQARQPQ
jgi:hypothetical protein